MSDGEPPSYSSRLWGFLHHVSPLRETICPASAESLSCRVDNRSLLLSGSISLFTTPVVACLVWIHTQLVWWDLTPFHSVWHETPYGAQLMTAIFLSDMCIYWGHRLSHQVPFLWRFHRVHHTAPDLDWLAAHREHPVDNLYTRTIENLPIFLLGFPLETIAGFVMFRGLWGLFIHSNINIKLGGLKYLIGSPHLHHWHHAKENPHCNYANLMPLMDVIFGT